MHNASTVQHNAHRLAARLDGVFAVFGTFLRLENIIMFLMCVFVDVFVFVAMYAEPMLFIL